MHKGGSNTVKYAQLRDEAIGLVKRLSQFEGVIEQLEKTRIGAKLEIEQS